MRADKFVDCLKKIFMKTNKTVPFYFLLLCCTFHALGQGQMEKQKTFRFGGSLPQAGNEDTLILNVWPHVFYYGAPASKVITRKVVADRGHFQFSVPAPEGPFYFTFSQLKKEKGGLERIDLLYYFIGESGDAITVYEKQGGLHFSGPGARKISVQYALKKLDTSFRLDYAKKTDSLKERFNDPFLQSFAAFSEPLLKQKIALLNKNRKVLSREVWGILKADLIGHDLESRIRSLVTPKGTPPEEVEKNILYCSQFVDPLFKEPIPTEAKLLSRFYVPTLLNYKILKVLFREQSLSGLDYSYLTNDIDKGLLDRFCSELVLRFYPGHSRSEAFLKAALEQVKTPYCREVLLQLGSNFQKGKPVYHFPFKDSTSKTVYLSELKGKLVFVDVWYVGCGNCYRFYNYCLKEVEEHFKNEPGIAFVSVCVEENRSKWLEAVNSGAFSSSSMINLTAGGFESPFVKYYNILGYPFQMLIDGEGKICRFDDLRKKPEDLIKLLNSYLQP